MIPAVVLTMSPETILVITQEAADALEIPRNTTAGAVQKAVAKLHSEPDTEMYSEDPYTEL